MESPIDVSDAPSPKRSKPDLAVKTPEEQLRMIEYARRYFRWTEETRSPSKDLRGIPQFWEWPLAFAQFVQHIVDGEWDDGNDKTHNEYFRAVITKGKELPPFTTPWRF